MDTRLVALKQFDESKAGVKGLVDTGLTSIPSFFVHPTETLSDLKPTHQTPPQSIPVIDLSGFDSDRRGAIVDQVSRSARDFGFFQIINHGISQETLDRTLAAVKAFHELPAEAKAKYYDRSGGGRTGFTYMSNVDLYQSKAASWRDTMTARLEAVVMEEVPEICRDAVAEWDREVLKLGEVVLELVGEGLGLCAGRFRDLSCLGSRIMVGHYYPYCPQSDLTVGLGSHADPGLLTLLLQNHMGGLQVKCGGVWLDVKPIPGAIVVNVGDLLQIMSNDEYKSVDHRVLANMNQEPRVSTAVFLHPGKREELYGPLPELSKDKPALYQQFTFSEFMQRFFTKELDEKSLKNFFRI
ncbi:1-aminocyclopropane-1-carboxylate oxidase homolog 1-like [Humulus lupulus]|uniref:1-aminocyclopropane-1-carboxylate oxidase homolog 1-like n=1 Tax=Humulus lupulus TaxID=3486 RepID=UPI002B415007|nr:1-aminocyclopropane-1-carboxylate oxidase homolog 1-like [Humulus lupulus]